MPPLKSSKTPVREQEKPKADLTDPVQRMDMIKSKLDTLTLDFGEVYGKKLTEELIKRLEFTIHAFHEDILQALDKMSDEGDTQREIEGKMRQGISLEDLLPDELKRPGKISHTPASDLFKIKIK
ncbi:MAG TPA: hypothetical protein ENO01_03485 [Candidatus Marinimicrobia bacterium]|nr:hypothetical protein [Candidatus Neomarinimicrobiota bacterium]